MTMVLGAESLVGAIGDRERILARNGKEERTKLIDRHTGDQESCPAGVYAVRQLVRKLACALARQAAREDHAAEQARECALPCESRSTHVSR